MSYILILAGAAMIFFGIKMKISKHTLKELSEQNVGKTMNAGCMGYFKIMLVVGGIALILIALIIGL